MIGLWGHHIYWSFSTTQMVPRFTSLVSFGGDLQFPASFITAIFNVVQKDLRISIAEGERMRGIALLGTVVGPSRIGSGACPVRPLILSFGPALKTMTEGAV